MISVIKCKITSVVDGIFQKIYSAIGKTAADTITDRSYFQHVGFTSLPRADAVGIVLKDGQTLTMIATSDQDTDRPAMSAEGDCAVYADADKYVKIDAGGEITVKNNNNTITLKANGDIELGAASLKKLMTEDMIAVFNAHTHAGVTVGAGVTGTTATPLSTGSHATSKVEAQ